MADETPGEIELFRKNFDSAVKNIALNKVRIKPLLTVQKSNAAEEYFYQESIYNITSSNQIPRGAEFTADQVKYTRQVLRPRKMGMESRIDWEDSIVNNVDIIQRTTLRIGNRIAFDVDTRCWNIISDSQSAVDINTFTASNNWNHATRSSRLPHEDCARAKRLISDSNLQAYQADTILLEPLSLAYLVTNDYTLSSFDSSSPEIMKTGNLGTFLGMNVIESPIVTDDYGLILEAGTCATYKEVAPMQTEVIRDPGIKLVLRGWEYGDAALTDPKAICLLVDLLA